MMYEEASQVANDAVSSIRIVASISAEEKVMDLYKRKYEGPLRTGIRAGIISGIGFGVSIFLPFGVYASSFYAGARLVEDKKKNSPKFSGYFLLSQWQRLGFQYWVPQEMTVLHASTTTAMFQPCCLPSPALDYAKGDCRRRLLTIDRKQTSEILKQLSYFLSTLVQCASRSIPASGPPPKCSSAWSSQIR